MRRICDVLEVSGGEKSFSLFPSLAFEIYASGGDLRRAPGISLSDAAEGIFFSIPCFSISLRRFWEIGGDSKPPATPATFSSSRSASGNARG